jgi:hypothetical protein
MGKFSGPDAYPVVYTTTSKTLRVSAVQKDPNNADPNAKVAVDLTGWTLTATVKRHRDDAAPIITKSSGVLATSTWSLVFDAGDFGAQEPGRLHIWVVGTASGGVPVMLYDGHLKLLAGP